MEGEHNVVIIDSVDLARGEYGGAVDVRRISTNEIVYPIAKPSNHAAQEEIISNAVESCMAAEGLKDRFKGATNVIVVRNRDPILRRTGGFRYATELVTLFRGD